MPDQARDIAGWKDRLRAGGPSNGRRRVVAAMSGGVDSSLAAALLVEAGHEVVGVSMRLCPAQPGTRWSGTCCSAHDLRDAAAVARRLGIPHHVLDLTSRFQATVLANFVAEYAGGRTPLPCAHCNADLKFAALVDATDRLGASWIATGHYARVTRDGAGGVHLWRGADARKDQAYFLFALTARQLSRAMFPIGGMTKGEVRREAQARGFEVADKPDSQEICFVPDGDYADVLDRYLPGDRSGFLADASGRILGRHHGVHRFTVGQRKGLGLATGEPLYVLRIDAERKLVTVGPREALERDWLTASRVNWVAGVEPSFPFRADVQIRSRHAAAPADIALAGPGRVRVDFLSSQAAVTPGQAAVIYRGDEVLGGGWID
ncbi:MAG TPA: tRNA 2-thiouridine(34) synthase MnmA [Vicinamibacterales bacterium]|nr:tRNA 2-thiouridine(34) synthase MnmA [Vicinamibacterales bacterium]